MNVEKRKWNIHSYPVLSLSTGVIEITPKNAKDIIFHIDEVIIKAGLKYELYEVCPQDAFFVGNTLKLTYREDRLKNSWPDSRGADIYSILQMHQWLKSGKRSDIVEDFYPSTTIYMEHCGKMNKMLFADKAKPLVSIYSDFVKFTSGDTRVINIILDSYSDVWFESVFNFRCDNSDEEYISNLVDAKLNAPRLNSFIRAIEYGLADYGVKFNLDPEDNLYEEYISVGRVMIEGEILYWD